MTKSVAPAFKARQSPAKSRADQGPLNTLIRLHCPELYWRRIIRLQYKSGHYRETETPKVSCSGDHRTSAWKKALSVISKSHTTTTMAWLKLKDIETKSLLMCKSEGTLHPIFGGLSYCKFWAFFQTVIRQRSLSIHFHLFILYWFRMRKTQSVKEAKRKSIESWKEKEDVGNFRKFEKIVFLTVDEKEVK